MPKFLLFFLRPAPRDSPLTPTPVFEKEVLSFPSALHSSLSKFSYAARRSLCELFAVDPLSIPLRRGVGCVFMKSRWPIFLSPFSRLGLLFSLFSSYFPIVLPLDQAPNTLPLLTLSRLVLSVRSETHFNGARSPAWLSLPSRLFFLFWSIQVRPTLPLTASIVSQSYATLLFLPAEPPREFPSVCAEHLVRNPSPPSSDAPALRLPQVFFECSFFESKGRSGYSAFSS